MGPENSGGQYVAYIDGKPVGPLEEITLTEETEVPGGVTEEDLQRAVEVFTTVWRNITVSLEVAARAISDIFQALQRTEETEKAIRWAEAYNRPLFSRYRSAKKKRIRKKYAKRILAWYREEVL